MKRIRLIIEYDGTAYVGWQTQPNGPAIQQLIEGALARVTKERCVLHASGRTDSGVHALAQVAHFDTHARMPGDKYSFALNALLPRDIRIRYAEEAPVDFHSRFDAKGKHYRYAIQLGAHARAFSRDTALHVHGPLDLAKLQSMADAVMGEHDFHAFMASGTTLRHTVRIIYRSAWSRAGDMLYYDVEGNGFLYNMVRILAGTMLDIGKGLLGEDCIKTALQSGRRADAGATAPAHGLTLMRVWYDAFDTAQALGEAAFPTTCPLE